MKGDFARVSFDPARHYSHVFQQQGRVLLEADWNEQAQIQLHLLRTLAKDLVGPCWAAGTGFGLTTSTTDAKGAVKSLGLSDWQLVPGHFYVDGILCVNEATCTLAAQPQAPSPDYGVADGKTGFENPPDGYALYLDVWERHLSAVEAPSIRDVALDGIDTCSRAEVVWQVRMLDQERADQQLGDINSALNVRLDATADKTAIAAIKQQISDLGNLRSSLDGKDATGNNGDSTPCAMVRQLLGARDRYALPRMTAQLLPSKADDDPCVIAADARYRGCENQLYRVEIHQGGLAGTPDVATGTSFKWSRENGSVVFAITAAVASTTADDGSAQLTVPLAGLGRDARLGLAVNDWVELVDDAYTLAQRAFPLLQVIAVDVANCSVTLSVPKNVVPYQLASDPGRHPLLRRWDQRDEVTQQGLLALAEGAMITLEDGISIRFEPGALYANGDYWLIPVRVAGNGTLDWPMQASADGKSTDPAALPARGRHHHAVLGVTDPNGDYQECCCRFGSLCELIQASQARQVKSTDKVVLVAPPPAVAVAAKKKSTTKKAKAASTNKTDK